MMRIAAVLFVVLLAGCVQQLGEPKVTIPQSGATNTGDMPMHSATEPGAGASSGTQDESDRLAALRQGIENAIEGAPATPGNDGVEPTVVALLAPLSGQNAAIGKNLLDAATLALFDIQDPRLKLMPYDTGASAEGARGAAQRAIADGAKVILGPLLSDAVEAASAPAGEAGVPLLAFSNNPSVAGNGAYLMGFEPSGQVEELVAYGASKGLLRYAVLAPRGAYGDLVITALQDAVGKYGATLERVGYYDPNGTDFGDEIKRLSDYDERHRALIAQRKELEARDDETSKIALKRLENLDTLGDPPFDAILLPATNSVTLRTLAAQLAYYDVDQPAVRVMGLQLWDDFPRLWNEPTLIGSWYVAPPKDMRTDYEDRFARTFHYTPARLSALGYDAMALVAVVDRAMAEPDYSQEIMTNPTGYLGVEGLFRFRPNGLADRGYEIREIVKGGEKTVRPAPDRFAPPIN